MYIVFTQIHENHTSSRWYYGTYETADRANEVALALGGEYPTFHCVCEASEAEAYGIQNLPF